MCPVVDESHRHYNLDTQDGGAQSPGFGTFRRTA